MWEFISPTASHVRSIWTCNEIEGLYKKSLYNVYWKLLFTAVGVVTYAVHSYTIQSYRRQQTRDVFHYRFVLWWYFYTNMYKKVGMACQIMYANKEEVNITM